MLLMEYERQTDRRRDGFKNSKHNPSRIYSLANVRNPYAQFSIIMALISGRAIRLLTADWRIAIISTEFQSLVSQIITTTVCYVYVIQLAVTRNKLPLSEGNHTTNRSNTTRFCKLKMQWCISHSQSHSFSSHEKFISLVTNTVLTTAIRIFVCRDSAVGIATGYGLDGPGIESRWRRRFPHLSRPDLGPTQPTVQRVPSLSRG